MFINRYYYYHYFIDFQTFIDLNFQTTDTEIK